MNQKIPKKISAQELHTWFARDCPKPVLIDVREDSELLLARFPLEVVHLPLSQASVWLDFFSQKVSRNSPVVVICHSGIRSWNFGVWILEHNHGYEVWNLEGGIDAWSQEVDSAVPRY